MAFLITGRTEDGKRIVHDVTGQRFMTDDQIKIEARAQEKIAAYAGTVATEMWRELADAKEQD